MKMRLLLVAVTCGLMLALAAPAFADDNPAQSAYSGVPKQPSGTLPFTGVDVGAVSAVAFVLVATGLVLRWRTRPEAD